MKVFLYKASGQKASGNKNINRTCIYTWYTSTYLILIVKFYNYYLVTFMGIGEELTFDYAMFNFDFGEDFECKCGSRRCRKLVKADDWCSLAAEYKLHYPSVYKRAFRAQLESSSIQD